MIVYDGIVCDSSIQVRRITISGASPSSLEKRFLNIFPYDDSVVGNLDEAGIKAYEGEENSGT